MIAAIFWGVMYIFKDYATEVLSLPCSEQAEEIDRVLRVNVDTCTLGKEDSTDTGYYARVRVVTVQEAMRMTSELWNYLDGKVHDGWMRRALVLNECPILGKFDNLPSEVAEEEMNQSLEVELNWMRDQMKYGLKFGFGAAEKELHYINFWV
eukprot:CAMPEP_0113561656 /NCGR_PEP_ID=MMETSP0015_2-20120614/20093_1 /TAXON_ID=2838 /ORGANISM="Odontella" /LENGTH=151 /DNA_ID=CAMNT_0000463467 /DNA_START=438 /DNA_END=893 /DNA_ORIENTATION=+ /assembly_acc=CAM_ASM_000160